MGKSDHGEVGYRVGAKHNIGNISVTVKFVEYNSAHL